MKKLLILSYILCLTTGLTAQVAITREALVELHDSIAPDTLTIDTTAVGKPWPENITERLDHLMQ